MKTQKKQVPNHSQNELAQGFGEILEKNRELFSVKELELCKEVKDLIEKSSLKKSKESMKNITSNLVSAVLKICLDADLVKSILRLL